MCVYVLWMAGEHGGSETCGDDDFLVLKLNKTMAAYERVAQTRYEIGHKQYSIQNSDSKYSQNDRIAPHRATHKCFKVARRFQNTRFVIKRRRDVDLRTALRIHEF